MFRTGSLLALCAACGTLVLSGLTAFHPERTDSVRGGDQDEAISIALPTPATADLRPLDFAPVFGEVTDPIDAVQVASVAPPTPRLELDLSGVLIAGQTRWAILDAAGESHVLREGEVFGEGYTVTRIMADRVEIDTVRGTVEIALGAAESRVASDAAILAVAEPLKGTDPATSVEPYRAMVKSVEMTRDDVETLVALAMNR